MTLRDVATRWSLRLKDAEDDIVHAARSASPLRLRVDDPSRCLDCGFVFRDRRRLSAPSRCPTCRSEATTEPWFSLA